MKRITTALLVLIVTLCAAFAAAQGGQVDNLDGQVSNPPPTAPATPPQGGTGIAPTPCSAEATASLYFAAADARAKRAQAETASVRATANQANSGIRRIDGELKGVREDTDKLNDTVYGVKGKDGERSGGYTTWREGVDKLLRGPDEKEGTTDDVRYVLYGDDGDKNVREIAESASTDAGNAKTEADTAKTAAESAKQTAASAAGGWVMWIAIAAIVLAVGALVKSFR